MQTKSQRNNPRDNLPSFGQQIRGLLPIIAVPLALMLLWAALHVSIALGLSIAGVMLVAGALAWARIMIS